MVVGKDRIGILDEANGCTRGRSTRRFAETTSRVERRRRVRRSSFREISHQSDILERHVRAAVELEP
ncbi:MAG: hypothetical protein MZU97_17825 [Bacillus subtilis]|nr:hypothetical protein [Bacillus subtilis]